MDKTLSKNQADLNRLEIHSSILNVRVLVIYFYPSVFLVWLYEGYARQLGLNFRKYITLVVSLLLCHKIGELKDFQAIVYIR